jgi:hypothetical protein
LGLFGGYGFYEQNLFSVAIIRRLLTFANLTFDKTIL